MPPRNRRPAIAVALIVGAAGLTAYALATGGDRAAKASAHRAAAATAPTTAPAPPEAPETAGPRSDRLRLHLRTTLGGNISPKSVAASGTGLVFAQNMMYRHTVTVYDARRCGSAGRSPTR